MHGQICSEKVSKTSIIFAYATRTRDERNLGPQAKKSLRTPWSISSTFYARFFVQKCFAQLSLVTIQLWNFWHQNIGAKCAHKMLMKLTPGVQGYLWLLLDYFQMSSSSVWWALGCWGWLGGGMVRCRWRWSWARCSRWCSSGCSAASTSGWCCTRTWCHCCCNRHRRLEGNRKYVL